MKEGWVTGGGFFWHTESEEKREREREREAYGRSDNNNNKKADKMEITWGF